MQPQALPRVMTADRYVFSVVQQYAVSTGAGCPASKAANLLVPLLKDWAGQYLLGIHFSGSYAKGTAISLGTDVDIFVSVDCGQPVKEIYWSFLRLLHRLQQVGTVPAMDIMNVCGESG